MTRSAPLANRGASPWTRLAAARMKRALESARRGPRTRFQYRRLPRARTVRRVTPGAGRDARWWPSTRLDHHQREVVRARRLAQEGVHVREDLLPQLGRG